MIYGEFDNGIIWEDDSVEEFKAKKNLGFVEPAMLAVITGLIGELSLLYITMHI